MKLTAIYCSATGNNEHLVNTAISFIKEKIPDLVVDRVNILKYMNAHYRGQEKPLIPKSDIYIFSCYSDYLQLPPFVNDFLSIVDTSVFEGSFSLSLNAHGGQGGTVKSQFQQFLLEKQSKYLGGFDAKYFTNCFNTSSASTYPKSDDQRLAINPIFVEELRTFINECVQVIQNPTSYQSTKVGFGGKFGMFCSGSILMAKADKCVGCKKCVDTCPRGVIELIDGKAQFTNFARCCACECCLHICPVKAITTENGKMDNFIQLKFEEWMFSKTRKGLVDKSLLVEDYQKAKQQ